MPGAHLLMKALFQTDKSKWIRSPISHNWENFTLQVDGTGNVCFVRQVHSDTDRAAEFWEFLMLETFHGN